MKALEILKKALAVFMKILGVSEKILGIFKTEAAEAQKQIELLENIRF